MLVLDASVILKWMLLDRDSEADCERATSIVESVISGQSEILQPVHWLAEVAAVLARLSPDTAGVDVQKLASFEFAICDEPAVWQQACILSIDTGQRLFDTLYHAVALQNEDTVLVTADERYHRKACHFRRIIMLRDLRSA